MFVPVWVASLSVVVAAPAGAGVKEVIQKMPYRAVSSFQVAGYLYLAKDFARLHPAAVAMVLTLLPDRCLTPC